MTPHHEGRYGQLPSAQPAPPFTSGRGPAPPAFHRSAAPAPYGFHAAPHPSAPPSLMPVAMGSEPALGTGSHPAMPYRPSRERSRPSLGRGLMLLLLGIVAGGAAGVAVKVQRERAAWSHDVETAAAVALPPVQATALPEADLAPQASAEQSPVAPPVAVVSPEPSVVAASHAPSPTAPSAERVVLPPRAGVTIPAAPRSRFAGRAAPPRPPPRARAKVPDRKAQVAPSPRVGKIRAVKIAVPPPRAPEPAATRGGGAARVSAPRPAPPAKADGAAKPADTKTADALLQEAIKNTMNTL